jgi:DNA-binding PadR family transcriptional regulator
MPLKDGRSRDGDLNNTAASVLGFLSFGPMSGWDIYRFAEDSIGCFWSISRSQVHRELVALEEQGLVEGEEAGARGRRVYTLTPEGLAALRAWLGETPGPEVIRIPFLIKVFFAQHMERDRLARLLRQERDRHVERLETFEKQLDDATALSPFVAATLRFGMAYESAVLQWFDDLQDEHPMTPR